MKDEQTKTAIMRWLVPTIALIVVVVIMLFNFSAKSSQSAAVEVDSNMINVAEQYATKVNHKLTCMTGAGKPIGWLMEECVGSEEKFVKSMAAALCDNTDAYAVVFCDSAGKGICQDGSRMNVNAFSYHTEIFDEKVSNNTDEREMEEEKPIRYIYVKDDELGSGKEAIVSVIQLSKKRASNKLLMYYPMDSINTLFKKSEFDADAFYSLISPDGYIMSSSGSKSEFVKDENIWTTIKKNPEYNDIVVKTIVRMKNKTTGSFSAVVNGEARRLVYAPVGINNWTLVIGINQSYVDNLQNREWSNTKEMIYQLVVAIWVFFGLVVVINILNKIKNSEKSKALEEKADTDLLTSLNNKLATERKIKEYIEIHPNEQGMMFILDIDNFKKINDTLGHAFGDEVLRSLGHQIGAVFRATDIVGRTGGDEFTIFLKYLHDDGLLEKEAKKLCNFFKNFQAGEYVKYAATASIGAAIYPKDGKDFESLYKAADNALYTAKKRGKNQLAFYGEEKMKSAGKLLVEGASRETVDSNNK